MTRKKMYNISQLKGRAGLVERGLFFVAGSIFLAVCFAVANESQDISTNLTSTFAITAQWRYPTATGAGYDTFEAFLENTGSSQITFKSVSSHGTNVACQTDEITWWQFYPSPQVNPNEAIVFRANFHKAPRADQPLVLTDSAGHSISITVPQFRVPEKLITAVTYSLNYDKVFIQFQADKATVRNVWLNGREISEFKLLKSAGTKAPDMLAFDTPFAITSGLPLHIRLKFSDGTGLQALVRALSGIMLDAYSIGAKERIEVGLDPDPAVCNFKSVLGGDVACYDTSKGKSGSAAPLLIEERLSAWEQQQNKLRAIHYCTAAYTTMWNLYGAIADAAFVNPYCLGYFPDKSRFIEEEENFLKSGWKSVRPSPFLWIPETFKSKNRFLEPEEIQVLAWMALVRGCKGIKYYAYGGKVGFVNCSLLLAAIKELNGQIRNKQNALSPLTLVSEEILGDKQTGVKVYTAWAGDSGILVLIRNLDYQTDDLDNDLGRNPRFKARAKNGLTVALCLPEWLVYRDAQDFFTGEPIPAVRENQNLSMSVNSLDAFRLVWLENKQ